MTRNLPSGDTEREVGCEGTLIDRCTVLSASDITSIRFAVKLAIYNTPRPSSSARSDAWPPMATTLPNVPAHAEAARHAAMVTPQIHDLLFIGPTLNQTPRNIRLERQQRCY